MGLPRRRGSPLFLTERLCEMAINRACRRFLCRLPDTEHHFQLVTSKETPIVVDRMSGDHIPEDLPFVKEGAAWAMCRSTLARAGWEITSDEWRPVHANGKIKIQKGIDRRTGEETLFIRQDIKHEALGFRVTIKVQEPVRADVTKKFFEQVHKVAHEMGCHSHVNYDGYDG